MLETVLAISPPFIIFAFLITALGGFVITMTMEDSFKQAVLVAVFVLILFFADIAVFFSVLDMILAGGC